MAMLSSRLEFFKIAQVRFHKRLMQHGSDPELLEVIKTRNPYIAKAWKNQKRARSKRDIWLVLPYHPVLARAGLQGATKSHCDSYLMQEWWKQAFADPHAVTPNVRIAWRLGGPPLQIMIRKLSMPFAKSANS